MQTTVAAVSTPRGKGGIATVRISGPDTPAVLDRVFRAGSGKKTRERAPRSASFGEITTPAGEVLDTGVAVFYQAPASYTGEDVAELSCHGGTAITEAVLSAVLEAGAAPAGRGEFTRRAFAAGKLTLSEAEAVGLLIDADTESRRRFSSRAVRGGLSEKLDALCAPLAEVLIALWAAIDYPEEDVGESGLENIAAVIAETRRGIASLLDTYKTGAAVVAGVRTVICGAPNVGKSALYNALCGAERAIVTAIPGTTRDVLEDVVDFGGITLRLADTAGLHDTADEVEKIGISRAEAAIRDAELVFAVADTSLPEDELLASIRALGTAVCGTGASVIGIFSKGDLAPEPPAAARDALASFAAEVVSVSALQSGGLAELSAAVARLYRSDLIPEADGAVLWDARQKAALSRTDAILAEAEEAIASGAPADALGVLAESALAELRRTDGRGVSDEIVDGIFARFCVGK